MSLVMQVSPKYTADKLASGAIEDKIDVFEDQMQGWFFAQARYLLDKPHSAHAALALTIGYFETYWIYASGEDSRHKSERFFTAGFLDVFPPEGARAVGWTPAGKAAADVMRNLAKKLYESGRCGLFHNNLTGAGILLRPMAAPITPSVSMTTGEVSAVFLDPEKILDDVNGHFAWYVARLRDPVNVELRTRFERAWEIKRPHGVIHLPAAQLPAGVARETSLAWGAGPVRP